MRVKQVSITKLFDVFDHTIPFNTQDRITIIHGPNGFGKTIMLKMIDGLFRGNLSIFRRIPFEEFRVDTDDGTTITIQRMQRPSLVPDRGRATQLRISGSGGEPPLVLSASITPDDLDFPLSAVEDAIPGLRRAGEDQWVSITTGQEFTLEDLFDQYGDLLPGQPDAHRRPDWLKEFQSGIRTHVVAADRLSSDSSLQLEFRYVARVRQGVSQATAVRYSHELRGKLKDAWAAFGALSQSRERTFPSRVVSKLDSAESPELTADELRDELKGLEDKRERLIAAGLLDRDDAGGQMPDNVAGDATRKLLAVYVDDTKEKLSSFDEILVKLESLLGIINQRYLYKKLGISRDEGFVIETGKGTRLSPGVLSSGEQHELVLLYGLLFDIAPGSLVLIDEPELSLHLAWQHEFLGDLETIASATGFDVLIATHAPGIINGRWDLTVELEGPEI